MRTVVARLLTAVLVASCALGQLECGGPTAPTPTPTPLPVVLPGGITLSFLSSSPSPGSTVRLGGPGPCNIVLYERLTCRFAALVVNVSLRSESAIAGTLDSSLSGPNGCYLSSPPAFVCFGGVPFNLAAGQTTTLQLPSQYAYPEPAPPECSLPLTTDRINLYLHVGPPCGQGAVFENVRYTFVQ